MQQIMKRNICLAPWCTEQSCEEEVKKKSRDESVDFGQDEDEQLLTGAAKTLCIPDTQNPIPNGMICFCCGKPALKWAVWGRTF